MEHYLDNSATTRVSEGAAKAAYDAMTINYGNPSSTYLLGREAKKIVDDSRICIANALGCTVNELYFTSCGSESDNWAILSGADFMHRKGKHVISSEVEHDAVRKSLDKLELMGYEVTRLKPEKNGSVSPDAVKKALRNDTVLVSLMMVNNETGAITDIKAISDVLKSCDSHALLHTDAVQAFMKIPFSAKTLGADMISISGHKIHAPKGIGALYIKKGLNIKPYLVGGSQESGLRAGTESVPLIAAFGEAAKEAYTDFDSHINHMTKLRDYAKERIINEIPEAVIINAESPHILSISMPGWRSEVIMNMLESKGVYVSKSSACKKGGRSHVLEAIGLDARIIDGAIRIGLSRFTDADDINALISGLIEARDTIRHR